jgi:serine/threonine protein kinase
MAPEACVVWNQPGEERIPRSFGRLWLLRRLARGGMGEVYLAATFGIEGAERPCVVKIIRREHAGDKSFVARFLDEARVQAQLQHHGVAQILEASTDPQGEPYVVVEYVEGRTLGELRARAVHLGVALEWPDVVAIGVSIAEALAHVHERTDASGKALGIVHRDLSPQNIMVGYDGDLKLIDFGTARAENRRCHTIAGVVFAKPGYVAPEVANGIPGDFRVDLYALGVMLWELLAGRRFLEGDPVEHLALVAKNERNLPPVVSLEADGAPAELNAVLARLTAFAVSDRFPSARMAASELVKMLSKAPGLATGERGVRARVTHLARRLYPAEPAKSRAEFGSLVKAARWAVGEEAKAKPPAQDPQPSAATSLPPSPSDMLPGTSYRLLRTIGVGAMGVVYEAEHVELMRTVALKVMSPELGSSTSYATRFRREAQAIARVSHPNLVATHDFGQASDGRLFCAMERLEGRTLEQWSEQEPRMRWPTAVRLGILACRGLQAAHGAGVVHRDIKPGNLFLTNAPVPLGEWRLDELGVGLKILDFGIVGAVEGGAEARSGRGELRIVGTPEYMAPEQARSCDIDARADVYALASVLYELCTGRPPYVDTSATGLLRQKSHGPPEPMRVRAPALGLPASLDRALMRALCPSPSGRYPTALDFRVALESVLAASNRRRQFARVAGCIALGSIGLFAVGVMGARMARPFAVAAEPATSSARANAVSDPTRAAPMVVPSSGTAAVEPLPAPAPTDALVPLQPAIDAPLQRTPPRHAASAPPLERRVKRTAAHAARAAAPRARAMAPGVASLRNPTAARDDVASVALRTATAWLARGVPEQALVTLREAARTTPNDVRLARAWAEAAAASHAWAEACEAADVWSFLDSGTEARLYLARMLAYGGHPKSALRILDAILEAHPDCAEARALHGEYLETVHGRVVGPAAALERDEDALASH